MAIFRFKQFQIDDHGCGMKICTDSVLLGAWADVTGAKTVIDLGAGSGLLALMCAQRSPCSLVIALEIDGSAAKAAKANFADSPWSERLAAVEANAADYAPEPMPDLIICNPPYFSTGQHSADSRRAMARHADSLSPIAAIDFAARWLASEGALAMVTPIDCLNEATAHAEMMRLKIRRLCRVSTSPRKSPTRLLWQISRADGPIEASHLSIRNADGSFSDTYNSLTSDFYL